MGKGMGKILPLAVILLFIGLAFAPSINASVVKDELVEFDVEFCGLGKKHTVKLTQEQADEIELLFTDIEQRLSKVETREETEKIFKEVVVELDKYGLLGGLSIRLAQRLVTGEFHRFIFNKEYEIRPIDEFHHNSFCLILGNNLNEYVIYGRGLFASINWYLIDVFDRIYDGIYDYVFTDLMAILIWIVCFFKPIHLFSKIGFGTYWSYPPDSGDCPASGRITTIGLEGIRTYKGDFYGTLNEEFEFFIHSAKIGVKGFTGIRLINKFIGFATEVGLKEA